MIGDAKIKIYSNNAIVKDTKSAERIFVPLLFLQRHDVLFDLFSSFTGWPWLGRKASRFFVAVAEPATVVAWTAPPPCTSMPLLVLLVLVRQDEPELTVTLHPVAAVAPIGGWYSCRRTPVVDATLAELGDEKLLMVSVGALPVTRDSWGENAFWWRPPFAKYRTQETRVIVEAWIIASRRTMRVDARELWRTWQFTVLFLQQLISHADNVG